MSLSMNQRKTPSMSQSYYFTSLRITNDGTSEKAYYTGRRASNPIDGHF